MPLRSRVIPPVAALAAATMLLGLAAPASAAEYPDWHEVQQARSSAAAKAREVAKIRGLLADSAAKAARTEQEAERRGAAYQDLRDRVETADAHLAVIRTQVRAADTAAKRAGQRAGLLAAELARTGGADVRASLFLDGGSARDADQFLDKLGRLDRLTLSNGAIAAEAERARRTAASTAARLQAAEDELERLRGQAKDAYTAAVAANDAADAELQHEQSLQTTLKAELAVLQSRATVTFAEYRQGLAAAAAANGAGAAGAVTASGWALPAAGPITDPFGYRPDRPAGANPFHRGTDIGGGCSNPIYAAHEGTVVYAGWYGTYGNFIEISHGGGLSTGYAHIRPGGTFVHVGQHVAAGQNIASIGTTGASTGCHLHFEVRQDEVATDPVPFMAGKGVTIG